MQTEQTKKIIMILASKTNHSLVHCLTKIKSKFLKISRLSCLESSFVLQCHLKKYNNAATSTEVVTIVTYRVLIVAK